MRIIGGEHRGRRIQAPPGLATRPMLDRVREALFSTLAPWIPGGRVLDLFAGSGSLGLEALSRGAAHVRFVERDERTTRLLADNARTLGLLERAEIVARDALAPAAWGEGAWADVVLLDPPYPLLQEVESRADVLAALHRLAREVLAPEGVLVLHAPRGRVDASELEPDLVARERDYGTNALWYVQRDEEPEA